MSYQLPPSGPYRHVPPAPTAASNGLVGLARSASPSTTGAAISLTPDHGTGYAAGINSLMARENVDMALDAQGLSSNAVQVGILKAKVQGLQAELAKAKSDGKDSSDKLSATAAKLNEQKIQNSSLLHKQNALMAKLSEAETNERDLEEALVAEKKAHNATREALEKSKNARDDLEAALQTTREALQRLQLANPAETDKYRDRSQYVPTSEHLEMQERFRRAHETLMEQVKGSFERIAQTQEEDETALFISRSAVLSSATDLETKLCHAENMLELLRGTMERFTREFEEDTGRMMLSLMNENKELWATVSRQQFDLDRANAEITARGRRDDYVHKDQVEYLNKTVTSLEERLKKSHDTIEQQTEAARAHAERMRDLMDENEALRRHLAECELDLKTTREALAAKEKEADDLFSLNKSLQIQIQDLKQANQHLQNQIANVNNELRSARETLENETRNTIRQLQNERDDAIDASNRLRGDLEEANQRLLAVERDLENRIAAFSTARGEWEIQHNNIVHALQDELANTRSLYDAELEELRREVAVKEDENRRLLKELEGLRLDHQSRNGTARALEEARQQLERELTSAKTNLQRVEEKLRKISTECDQFRGSSITLEGRVQTLTAENNRLTSQVSQLEDSLADERARHTSQSSHLEREWKESERTRTTLIEEITKLRAKANEDSSLKNLKDRMEKEKEMLMAENVRLHQSYQDVQQQNVQLQQQLTQLRGKLSGIGQLTQQLDDVQRRLAELPSIRQQAEDARREALRAKEEAEMLRQERDEMSQRLEFFLEEARANAKKDTDLDRLFREASSQVRRLDQQIDEVTHRQPAGEMILSYPTASAPQTSTYRTNTSSRTTTRVEEVLLRTPDISSASAGLNVGGRGSPSRQPWH